MKIGNEYYPMYVVLKGDTKNWDITPGKMIPIRDIDQYILIAWPYREVASPEWWEAI